MVPLPTVLRPQHPLRRPRIPLALLESPTQAREPSSHKRPSDVTLALFVATCRI